MLRFGLGINFQALITRIMVRGTLLALDHALSSKSCSRCFDRSWTAVMEIVLIWIAVIGTHLIISLTLRHFLILTRRSCGCSDPCKGCSIRVEGVLIILLFHAGVLLLGMSVRCSSLLHIIIQRILILADGTVHYIYMIVLAVVAWTYLRHHFALIHLSIIFHILRILSLKVAVFTTLANIAAHSNTLRPIHTKYKRVRI